MSRAKKVFSAKPVASARHPGPQRGFLMITSVVLIVVAALLLTVMVFFGVADNESSVRHSQSGQALFVGESGTEYEQRQLARNVDWYRATTDPFDNTPNTFGQGSYTVFANLPATELRMRLTAAGTTANVFAGGTVNRWPASGTLMIDDNITDASNGAEFVTYTSTTATTFTITARNKSVNGVVNPIGAGTGLAHPRGTNVYPVTTLLVALANNCATIPNPFTITANTKFLDLGIITVLHNNAGTITSEQISYSSYTDSGATRTLSGVQRCQNQASSPGTAITASVGDPVLPMAVASGNSDNGGAVPTSFDYEVEVTSTGNVSSAQRVERKTVQR